MSLINPSFLAARHKQSYQPVFSLFNCTLLSILNHFFCFFSFQLEIWIAGEKRLL